MGGDAGEMGSQAGGSSCGPGPRSRSGRVGLSAPAGLDGRAPDRSADFAGGLMNDLGAHPGLPGPPRRFTAGHPQSEPGLPAAVLAGPQRDRAGLVDARALDQDGAACLPRRQRRREDGGKRGHQRMPAPGSDTAEGRSRDRGILLRPIARLTLPREPANSEPDTAVDRPVC